MRWSGMWSKGYRHIIRDHIEWQRCFERLNSLLPLLICIFSTSPRGSAMLPSLTGMTHTYPGGSCLSSLDLSVYSAFLFDRYITDKPRVRRKSCPLGQSVRFLDISAGTQSQPLMQWPKGNPCFCSIPVLKCYRSRHWGMLPQGRCANVMAQAEQSRDAGRVTIPEVWRTARIPTKGGIQHRTKCQYLGLIQMDTWSQHWHGGPKDLFAYIHILYYQWTLVNMCASMRQT